MDSSRTAKLTPELLHAYSHAALRNADELLAEASLLRDNGHMARAYFLAVSCIEEAGKALQAFDGQRRNLADPAVCKILITRLENHGQKINYALGRWAMGSPDPRAALKVALDLIGDLKRGREPAMYSDLRAEPDRAEIPSEVVRAKAAEDCVRLARDCLEYAKRHVSEASPQKFSTADDRLFTMKVSKFQALLETEDFWWFVVAQTEAGKLDFAETVTAYLRDYLAPGKQFGRPSESDQKAIT